MKQDFKLLRGFEIMKARYESFFRESNKYPMVKYADDPELSAMSIDEPPYYVVDSWSEGSKTYYRVVPVDQIKLFLKNQGTKKQDLYSDIDRADNFIKIKK